MVVNIWVSALFALQVPYWNDPRIHNMGNGKLHALLARPATKVIDFISYDGRNVRKEVLDMYVGNKTCIDFCCGTGTSTSLQGVGIDTSPSMISEALWRRGKSGSFYVANAETYGLESSFEIVTIFFALHEMPIDAIRTVIKNAKRVASEMVIICDISPQKVPSDLMLSGEPYLEEYQKHIFHEIKKIDPNAYVDEIIPKHVLLCLLEAD